MNLKALIIGADAVCPDYIFNHQELYPNISKLIKNGVHASYSAYVQKGFSDSYLSEMNWSSIYTGLEPWRHNIVSKDKNGIRKIPSMNRFDDLMPFWKMYNKNGLTVGMWSADCCISPVEIEGYVISSKYELIETPSVSRESKRTLEVCGKDKKILESIAGSVPPRLYPKTLKQQGFSFDELKNDSEQAWNVINNYHFQDSLNNFQKELEFFYNAIYNAQSFNPVDVLYFYTPSTDLIAHCCMYCNQNDVLIEAYKILDSFIGRLLDDLNPENVIVMSDHGMVNFGELVRATDETIRYEAFSERNNVLWLKNGYMAFEAKNGALLFTAHALKGMFIASGKKIKNIKENIDDIRTVDIYPILLELFRIRVDDDRNGYIHDIFNDKPVNINRLYNKEKIAYKNSAVFQCYNPSLTDILINEVFLHNRFEYITVIGEEKYKEIYLNNPRVSEFIKYDNFDKSNYDCVYIGKYNETTGLNGYIKL